MEAPGPEDNSCLPLLNIIWLSSLLLLTFLLPNIAAQFISKRYDEPLRSFSAPFLARNYEDVSIQKRSAESPLRYTVPSFVPNTAAEFINMKFAEPPRSLSEPFLARNN